MKRSLLNTGSAALALAVLLALPPAGGQTGVSTDGLIESTAGGFKFPDGSVQATAASGSAPVERSGQTTCWTSAGDPVGCMGSGQDGDLQAGVAQPVPRFASHGDGTVTDNLTGLVWLELADCLGLRSWETALTDANTLVTAACGLGDGSQAGDWRLPTLKELLSLIDYGHSLPALPPNTFSSVRLATYWTSTSLSSAPTRAWAIDLSEGDYAAFDKATARYVWPVQGGR